MIYIYYVISNNTFDILYDMVKINVQYLKIDQKYFLRQTVGKEDESQCSVWRYIDFFFSYILYRKLPSEEF